MALSDQFELRERDSGKEVLAHAETVQNDLIELSLSSASEESVQLRKK